MKKFHEALNKCRKEAESKGLSFHGPSNDGYFDFIEKCIKNFKMKVNGKDVSVNKTPFCFFEGDPLSLEDFKKDLKSDGFSFDAPSGLAKFNPRNPSGQPPIFTFRKLIPI